MISTALVAEEFEGEDMPVSQWAVLTILEHHPEIDQSRLSEIVSIDKTNTGRLVDQLEAKGMVERRPNDSDRRVWMLRCTPLGLKTRKRLRPRALATQEKLLSCLAPAERERFNGSPGPSPLERDARHCAKSARVVACLTKREADPPFVEQQETTMNHDLLNDEQLDIAVGGKPAGGHGSGTGGGTGGGGGNGTGGGDGLGWLRNLIRGIFG